MTFNPTHYPADWKAVRARVLEREGGRCKWCGVVNGGRAASGSTVVLTIAHLCRCRDPEGRKCGDESHLAALCQRCHLAYDRDDHMRHARETRHAKKAVADLFPDHHAPLAPKDPLTAGPRRS